MPNSFFQFKQFTIHQDRSAMKVTTDSCLFGAWVAEKLAKENANNKIILDIGTGTGLLSLMVAQKINLHIDAVEIDPGTFQQASENISSTEGQNRIQVFNEDIRKYEAGNKYDYIICNPPFYENELQSPDKNRNLAHHSAALTLEELLKIIKKLLSESGRFFLLLPYKRENELHKMFAKNDVHIRQKMLVKQSVSHGYFRIMIQGSFEKSDKTEQSEIPIRDKDAQYTSEFTDLLKDYYLYL